MTEGEAGEGLPQPAPWRASKCPGYGRHWFAGGAMCMRCGEPSPEAIAFHKRRQRTDDCGGTGKIGYGRRVYPGTDAAFAKYRDCEGTRGCHQHEAVQR